MKRFTATEKWDKGWFHELPCHLKCFWTYLCDTTDAAGVWEPNYKLAGFLIGKTVTALDLAAFGDRVEVLPNGKVWLTTFIEFQYGKLSEDCRPHLKIFEALRKHGLEYCKEQHEVFRSRVGHVSQGKREAIYERDGRKCVYCESQDALEPDHIVSRKRGGGDGIANLVTACHKCNTEKGDLSVEGFLEGKPSKQRVLSYLDTLSEKSGYPTNGRGKDKDKEKEEETVQEGGSAEGGIAEVDRFEGLPKSLDSPLFREAWIEYVDYRKERHLPKLLRRSVTERWKECEIWGVEASVNSIRQAIANGWQGLFPPKANDKQHKHGTLPESDMPKVIRYG